MKRILIAAIAASSMATSAFAYTDASETMVNAVAEILDSLEIDSVNVEDLSDTQIASIYIAGTSSSDQSEKEKEVRSFLTDKQLEQEADAGPTLETGVDIDGGSATMMEMVQNLLDENDIDADVSTLTDAQIAGIYIAGTSSGEEGRQKDRIEAILK
ncbi:hypothetical protein [Profundibacterium mesophilum]|uniref:DUF1002 domain-containing protein n=1 Tax=Profundibacterium mesophilum KAUST100406-0324 TaxID=1037889 RepID=A0A921TF13_9RHOB|nr:hypothetical protein [Profundibacterium mesophilum]KAF0676004.1 hypothetical protein PMES_01760 [Profundibacterium mesophilum KAUST100406-0324]